MRRTAARVAFCFSARLETEVGASCFGSQLTASSGHNKIPFDAALVVNGQPTVAVDPSKLIGVRWQLGLPTSSGTGCHGSVSFDNITFC
jgi:hypothetical protein